MSFFLRIFGRSKPSTLDVDKMSLADILEIIQSNPDGLAAKMGMDLYRRLIDFSLFEHGTSDQERESAMAVARALRGDIEQALADDEDALSAFQEAAEFQLGQVRFTGVGSLQWLMEENEISTGAVVEYISLAAHSDLLPDFLEMLEPEVIAEIRSDLIRQLSKSRSISGENQIETLLRLVSSGDGALPMLLSGPELSALRAAKEDRGSALSALSAILS